MSASREGPGIGKQDSLIVVWRELCPGSKQSDENRVLSQVLATGSDKGSGIPELVEM
jgi:hypothetical protein